MTGQPIVYTAAAVAMETEGSDAICGAEREVPCRDAACPKVVHRATCTRAPGHLADIHIATSPQHLAAVWLA